MDSSRRMYWEALWWLTGVYFVIEVVINIIVFKQLSIKSDFITIEGMEFWGKIITGVGAALAFTKIFYALKSQFGFGDDEYYYATESLKVMFLGLLICIPLSFYLQNKLIETMVDNSTAEERNRAILIINTQVTMKPHYNPLITIDKKPTTMNKLLLPIGGMKDSFIHNYEQKQNVLFSASKKCIEGSGEMLGVISNIDKAFFAYNALNSPMQEHLYKNTITYYNSCLLTNATYLKLVIPTPEFDDTKFRKFYEKYLDKTRVYYEANAKAEKSIWSSVAKEKVYKEWLRGVSKTLGFESTLSPYLNYDQFVRDPDIQKYFRKKAKPEELSLIPYSDGFEESLRLKMAEPLKELLPNTAIPTYISEGDDEPLGNFIKYPKKYQGEKAEVTQEQIEHSGKQAYKGIVMPIVALGASLTFLLLNIVIVISQLIVMIIFVKFGQEKPPFGLKLLISLVLVAVIIGVPISSNINDDENGNVSKMKKAVEIIYYYEKALVSILGINDNSISRASFKIGEIITDTETNENNNAVAKASGFNISELEKRTEK